MILEWRSTSVEGDDAASNSIPWARGPAGRTQLRALSARADAPGVGLLMGCVEMGFMGWVLKCGVFGWVKMGCIS